MEISFPVILLKMDQLQFLGCSGNVLLRRVLCEVEQTHVDKPLGLKERNLGSCVFKGIAVPHSCGGVQSSEVPEEI